LKIGPYLTKLRRTKNGANFLGHPVYMQCFISMHTNAPRY